MFGPQSVSPQQWKRITSGGYSKHGLKSRPFLLALAAHVAVLLAVMPASPWEFDEILFFQGLHRYDPLAHHPPPPGYPVFILFGQLVRLLIPSDFATLLTISVVASIAGFAMLALTFRNLAGDETTGVIGAALFYFSPAMLIHSTLPISDPGGLALLAASLYFGSCHPERSEGSPAPGMPRSARHAALFALFAALAVGWRIQLAIFVVPYFLVAVALMRTWRARLIALATFTLVCLIWLTPLTLAVGGVRELVDFETGQGKYLAAHDAAESRTGWTPARIAFRFIGRAWGTAAMSLVVLAFAAVGFIRILRRRLVPFLPLAAGAAIYIGVALWVMDPADGVRYALPFTLVTAFVAAAGIAHIPRFAWGITALAALAFLLYTGPLLLQRRTTDSPPFRAAMYARAAFPPNAIALYELPLWPHAQYFLADHNPERVDDGLAKFWNHPDVPLFIYADGASSQPDARVFRWKASDAYTKLTRNHYRVSSIIPLPPERRFRIIRGINAPEREQEGLEWRWLDSPAELQLPNGPSRAVTFVLGLSPATPLDSNVVTIFVNDQAAARVAIVRLKRSEVTIRVPAGAPIVRLVSERTFIPAEIPSMRSGDRRRLAVELYELRTIAAAAHTRDR